MSPTSNGHTNDSSFGNGRLALVVLRNIGIIFDTRGAVAHVFLGSVAERVVRKAPCPVLTVHHLQHEFIQAPMATAEAVAAG